MENMPQHFECINQAEYLYLRALKPLGIAELEITIEEAIVNETMRGKIESSTLPSSLSFLLAGAAPIESVEGCLAFRFYWKHITAFLVTEECVGSCGKYDDEIYEGNKLRLYSRSHFLEHLARDTGGHLGELIHYKIICQDQLIDVVSDLQPEIEILTKR